MTRRIDRPTRSEKPFISTVTAGVKCWQDDDIVGYIASGAYGHTLGGCIGLGYVNGAAGSDPKEQISAGGFEIEIAGVRFPADASLRPMYDPDNRRVRDTDN